MKRLFIIAFMASIIVGCNTTTPQDGVSTKATPIKVETIEVTPTHLAKSRSYVGVVEERNSANLSFAVAGTVAKVAVGEGERVSKGQLLMTLSSPNIEESLVAAQATYDQALDGFERAEKLHNSKSMTELDFVAAETKLQQAKSSLKIAEKNVEYTALYAPYAGVVGHTIATVGEFMLPSVPVMTLLEVDNLAVKIAVPEREIASVEVGATTSIRVGALGGKSFEGVVLSQGVVSDAMSHTYEAMVSIKGSNLLPGMIAEVALNREGESQITIPNRAVVLGRGSNRYVWIVEDGKAQRREIEVDGLSSDGVVVSGGLSAGDEVIVSGYQKVSVGSNVEVVR